MIPDELKRGLDDYAQHGTPTGGFLRAVLANDLMEAVGRADDNNVRLLKEICSYIYNEMPSRHTGCWGSYEAVDAWIEKHRLDRERNYEDHHS